MSMPESITPRVIITTTKEHHLRLSREMLIAMLRLNNLRVTDDAVISVHVQGEGAYANRDVVISNSTTVEVKWKTTEKSG